MLEREIKQILGISESYQLCGRLMEILFDEEKKIQIFEKFLATEKDLSHDWFLDYFQKEQAARKSLKQDYTPDCVCRTIAALAGDGKTVLDVCAGIGGLTISIWNENRTVICEELSDTSVSVLLFNLAIRNMNAYVRHCDVLSGETKNIYRLTAAEKFSEISISAVDNERDSEEVDIVVSNPPYSLRFEDIDRYKEDDRFKEYALPPKSKMDYAFILHGLNKLASNGTAVYILPHGVLFRGNSEGAIRKKLIENNVIDAIIGLPEKLFTNTDIPVCILVIKKDKKDKDILFIDASEEFEKKGNRNNIDEAHIKKITETYKNRAALDRYSRIVSLNEIEKNDYNLNIRRYVDISEPPEKIDLKAVIDELEEIEKKTKKTTDRFLTMLHDLRGDETYEKEKNRCIEYFRNKDTCLYLKATKECEEVVESGVFKYAESREVMFYDIAEFERSRKDKRYPKGSILIQVSATRGELKYMDDEGVVDSKYGVIQSKINSKYLYYILEGILPDFLKRYQTGLNINPDIFKFLSLCIHVDEKIQESFVGILDFMKEGIISVAEEIALTKKIKQYHMEGMLL